MPLVQQAIEHGVTRIALTDPDAAAAPPRTGPAARCSPAPRGSSGSSPSRGADLVLNSIVGSAGLGPTIVALTEGMDVALANKESLVVGGELVTALAEATGARLIPIDSEHTAIHHLLTGEPPGVVDKLIITASGGPFRGRKDLQNVTVEEALKHPTWSMGGKITIDSATLMNKGLELMEAHHLFGDAVRQDRRRRPPAVDHPRARAALRRLDEGAHGLSGHARGDRLRAASPGPRRPADPAAGPDRARPARRSRRPTSRRFPCLRLAREAAVAGGTAPCALNAANEVAVHAFLNGRLSFTGIPEVIEGVLDELGSHRVHDFEALYVTDAEARELAAELIEGVTSLSWILAFLGFAALVILHEAGHFFAAKAVGMRVERFALFFPPLIGRASAARPSTRSARSRSAAT